MVFYTLVIIIFLHKYGKRARVVRNHGSMMYKVLNGLAFYILKTNKTPTEVPSWYEFQLRKRKLKTYCIHDCNH